MVPVGRALILTLDMFDVQVVPGLGGDRVAGFSEKVEGDRGGDGLRIQRLTGAQ
jgi:hypothetical protein